MHIVEWVRQFIRNIMKRVANWLNRVTHGSLHPTTVTVVGVVMHLPIALLIAAGKLPLAGVLLIVFGLFDTLDGELARLQNRASEAGMFLDASTDRIKEVLLYTGIAYFLSVSSRPAWTSVAVVACGASLTANFIKAKGEVALALTRKHLSHHEINHYYHEGVVPFDVRMLLIVIGLLSSQILVVTVLIAVLASYMVFERLNLIIRQL